MLVTRTSITLTQFVSDARRLKFREKGQGCIVHSISISYSNSYWRPEIHNSTYSACNHRGTYIKGMPIVIFRSDVYTPVQFMDPFLLILHCLAYFLIGNNRDKIVAAIQQPCLALNILSRRVLFYRSSMGMRHRPSGTTTRSLRYLSRTSLRCPDAILATLSNAARLLCEEG